MKAKRIKKYDRHGCLFVGNLLIVDYVKDIKRDPRYGQFGLPEEFEKISSAA